MSTALATRPTAALQPIDDAFVKVIQWVAASGYFLEAKDEARAAVKMLIGRELGLPPMASMMGIDIIDTKRGPRPRLSANIMAGLIKASGEYDYTSATSATSASVTVVRNNAEGPPTVVGTVSYSIEEARKAGLVRDGSPWVNYSPDMLFARAMSRTKRLVPHLFVGLSGGLDVVLPEEVDDEPMTDDQRKAIFAQLKGLGITERDRRLLWASDVLGREVQSFTTLTRADAVSLLDWLAPNSQNANQAGDVGESTITGSDYHSVDPPGDAAPRQRTPGETEVGGGLVPASVPVHPRGGGPANAGTIPRQPALMAASSAASAVGANLYFGRAGEPEAVGGGWQRADPAGHGDPSTADGSLAEGATVLSDNGDHDRHTELVFKIAAAHSEWARTMPKGAESWFNGFLAHVKRPNLDACEIEELEAGWDWLIALNRAK